MVRSLSESGGVVGRGDCMIGGEVVRVVDGMGER